MKKLFTLIAFVCITVVGRATDYACQITVSMSGESMDPEDATVTIEEEEGGTYSLSLKNFYLSGLPVGTINLTGVEGTTDDDGVLTLTAEQDITISDGDDIDGVTWIGYAFGTVGVGLDLTVDGTQLSGSLDIDVTLLGYTVTVTISPASDSDSGVTGVASDATKIIKAYYNINGQQIKTPAYGQLYIIQYTDGTAVKRVNK